jgi:hypothetical protein
MQKPITQKRVTAAALEVMTIDQRRRELLAFVNLCAVALGDVWGNAAEMARLTGLHVSTCYRLQGRLVSLATHFGTIQALGHAAGLRLVMEKTGARMIVENGRAK